MKILEIFKQSVMCFGQNLAVYDNEKSYTYKELDCLSDNVASELSSHLGNIKDIGVPLIIDQSADLIVLLLALYKLGAFYIPIARNQPSKRIEEMLKECKYNKYISANDYSVENKEYVDYKTLMSVSYCSDSKRNMEYIEGRYAYMIYTSGSTGTPKGVAVTHKNLSNLLQNMQSVCEVQMNDRYILTTPYTFDVSVTELFCWIYSGASLYIPFTSKNDYLKKLGDDIIINNITHVCMSPSVLSMFLKINKKVKLQEMDRTLKYIMIAGEEFLPEIANNAKEIFENAIIVNMYGPTETTVYVTYYYLEKDKSYDKVPIGVPFSGVRLEIDSNNGELMIGGKSVSDGYIYKPELSKEKFVVRGGMNYYKSGDLCVLDGEGQYIYCGRIDTQIQINGIRIETAEIENHILKYGKKINNVQVMYLNRRLVCFYESDEELMQDEIVQRLQEEMPEYMIPHIYIQVVNWPLTLNRKTDTKALTLIFNKRFQLSVNTHEMTNTEAAVIKILKSIDENWRKIGISADTNVFSDLGFSSLDSIIAVEKLEIVFSVKLYGAFLYDYQTIRSIANYLDKKKNNCNQTQGNVIIDRSILERNINFCLYIEFQGTCTDSDMTRYHKRYYKNQFDSVVADVIHFEPQYFSLDDIKKRLERVIASDPVLRCKMQCRQETPYFTFYDSVTCEKIPCIIVDDEIDVRGNLELFEDISRINIFANILNHILYRMLLIKSKNGIFLYYAFSHYICDLYSLFLFRKNMLAKILPCKSEFNYFDYIKAVNELKNASPFFVTYEKIKKEITSFKPVLGNENSKYNIIQVIATDTISRDRNEIIGEIIEEIASKLALYYGNDRMIFSVITELRKINNMDFTECMGDCHTSVWISVDTEKNKKELIVEQLNCRMREYECGIVPQYISEHNIKVEEWSRLIKQQICCKLNFIGFLDDSEMTMAAQQINTLCNNSAFKADKRIYVTAFVCNKKIYLLYAKCSKEFVEFIKNSSEKYIMKEEMICENAQE